MIKNFIIVIAGFTLVALTLGAVKVSQIKTMSSVEHVMPPTAVTTAAAMVVEWRSMIDSIGTLAPVQGVTLGADADGIIASISVENGAAVKAGDVLVQFDTGVEVAQLASAQARADLARINYERAKDLWDRNATSKSEYDQADATLKQAEADVVAISAQIAKKQVRAPFDGRVGIRLVNVGQFVPRGSPLMPLQKLNPIFVNFGIPQRNVPALASGQEVEVKIDAFPARLFKGHITAVNSQVDPATRNISVQATLENPNEELRSGMFARVS
ncbi:MAG: Multidrug resistance protein MdtA precursor, partial [Verrucomicrobiota bacterium]